MARDDQEDFSVEDKMVMNKWQRDQMKREALAEASEEKMKEFLAGVKGDPNAVRRIAKDLGERVKGGRTFKRALEEAGLGNLRGASGHGYNLAENDELITGMEPLPWNSDKD